MLPSHSETSGWREMAISGGDPEKPRRQLHLLRLRFRLSRFSILVAIAALFTFAWVLISFVREQPLYPPRFRFVDEEHFEHYGPPPARPPAWRPFAPPPHPGDKGKQWDDSRPKVDWNARAEKVKEAFLHAYHGYEEFALPADELLPLTNKSVNNFNGWGVTLVDALDTMYLMGLNEEFERGVTVVENMNFTAGQGVTVPFFETTIRYLGGLLSAYALSHDVALLKRADELGSALLPVFNTTSGLPSFSVNTATGETRGGWSGWGTGWLAEIASCQMEFKYLAKLTGRKEYYVAANTVMERLYNANATKLPNGLFPTLWNLTDGQPINYQVSIGAMADSAYEYLLKQWLLTSQTEKESLEMYKRTISAIIEHNLYLSPTRHLLYVTDFTSSYISRKFEHLSCFVPGLIALGAATLPPMSSENPSGLTNDERELHMWAAQGLGEACAAMYNDMPTGLGAEEVSFLSAWDLAWRKATKERDEEASRLSVEAAAETATAATIREGNLPPMPGTPGGPPRKVKVKDVQLNITEEDEKLRWVNALGAWREGQYVRPGSLDTSLDVAGLDGRTKHGGAVFGHAVAEAKAHGRPPGEKARGPAPGLEGASEPGGTNSSDMEYRINNFGYYLRPETIESFFILWRTTGDEIWRERGWRAFEAIEKYCKTPSGYAALRNVVQTTGTVMDSMPSYFLAETLKYLYLLFADESALPLDKYVLNTEAHPFPVFEWTDWEKRKFGIET